MSLLEIAGNISENQQKIVTMNYCGPSGLITSMKVDFVKNSLEITNYTDDVIVRAFGVNEKPSWSDFLNFLESRVVPKSRDRMKQVLKDIGVQCWDPMLIIEKTQGRMINDSYWIEVIR